MRTGSYLQKVPTPLCFAIERRLIAVRSTYLHNCQSSQNIAKKLQYNSYFFDLSTVRSFNLTRDCFEFMIGSEQLYVDNMDWTHSKHVLDKEITSKYWQNIELVCNSEKE